MTQEQMTARIVELTEQIAAARSSLKSAHKRIDDNDKITAGIHEVAASVQALAIEVKMIAEKWSKSEESIKNSIKSQGERIGKLEKEPADKWKSLVAQVIGLVVAAVVGVLISKFI